MLTPPTIIDEDVKPEELRPTQDHLLVKLYERDKTGGGIHLPKNAATACRVAKVLSRGKAIPNSWDGRDFPFEVKSGDYVIFMDYAGEKVQISWQDYRLIREHGLWGKVQLSPSGDIMDFESIEPWADRLVIERRDESKTKSGLLHLPNADLKLAWNVATVKWAGFGVWHQTSGKLLPCESKPGDKILFRRYSGEDIKVRGKEYRITQEIDVIAILDGKDETLRPLRNKVVVRRDAADSKTAGGLLIPDAMKAKKDQGVVAAAADLLRADGDLHEPPYKVGDRVIFQESAGTEVTHNGKEYVVLDHTNILAVIE